MKHFKALHESPPKERTKKKREVKLRLRALISGANKIIINTSPEGPKIADVKESGKKSTSSMKLSAQKS